MAPGVLSLAPLHWSEELGPRLSLVQAVFPVAWCAGAPHAGGLSGQRYRERIPVPVPAGW